MSTLRCKFTLEPRKGRRATSPNTATLKGPSRGARTLALAHHVERLVEAGELASYAAAARALGLTRARLTQVMRLLLLAPEIQERLLLGEVCATERLLRGAVKESRWTRQEGALEVSTRQAGPLRVSGRV